MARVGRLAGALLVETGGQYFLVGNTKEPCDFAAVGFEPPPEIDARVKPCIRLSATGPVQGAGPWLALEHEGEEVARLIAERFLIERNGSVSERLWRLVIDRDGDGAAPSAGDIDARWLAGIPAHIWQIVRDTVLRCT
jgi:hypothetical protein